MIPILFGLATMGLGQIIDVAGEEPDVHIVGSSTVAPFSLSVANILADDIVVRVQSVGTHAGFDALCGNAGHSELISAASRQITNHELEKCAQGGVEAVLEIPIGYDGVVLAHDRRDSTIPLTTRDLFLALARKTPRGENDCMMTTNRRATWGDVRDDLPSHEILVIGQSHGAGTRDAFVELIVREGARSFPCLARMEETSPEYFAEATRLRSDGVWVDGGDHDYAIAHTLTYVDGAIGVFPFATVSRFRELEVVPLDGIEPSPQTIQTGHYPGSRMLYLYTTDQAHAEHNDVAAVVSRFKSFEAIGPTGYLTNLGLVPGAVDAAIVEVDTQ